MTHLPARLTLNPYRVENWSMNILQRESKPRPFAEGLLDPVKEDRRLEAEAAKHDPFAGTPPSEWPDWCDQRVTTGSDRLTLAELVGLWSERFASLETGPSGLVGEVLEDLASDIHAAGVSTPDAYRKFRAARRRHASRADR